MTPFTKRHQEAIYDGRIRVRLGKRLRRRIMSLVARHGTEDDGWDGSILPELYDRLVGVYGVSALQAKDEDFEDSERHDVTDVGDFILGAYPTEVFDVIEVFHDMLDTGYAVSFGAELNEIMEQERIPWLLVDSHVLEMDRDFLKIRLAGQAHDLLQVQGFEGALQEFQDARNDLSAKDAKDCIREASNAFESTMKSILGRADGNASDLIDALRDAGYFDGLPEPMRKGFGDKVMMALPYVRNRLGGHGQGAEIQHVPMEYAELALNLSAALITFAVRRHEEETKTQPTPQQATRAPLVRDDWGPDEAPF